MNSTPSAPGKSLSAPPTSNFSQAPPQAPSPIGFDSARRQGTGQGQGSSASQSAPRRNQGARRQHKDMRRPGAMRQQNRVNDDEDMLAEIRAMRNTSSRRGQTSITHLLNLNPPPRPVYDSHHSYSSRSYRRNPSYGVGSGYHSMDKARYVHANYRFVVSPSGTYTAQASDADEHLEWTDILQIIASTESQQTSCPICLSEPVAPRMAKCGHIFCLPCLIRFMNTVPNDDGKSPPEKKQNRWRKCPICDDTVYLNEVRPVRFYAGQESALPRPGEDVVLRLMARNAKSTLALPKEGAAEVLHSGDDIPWHFAANVLDYARIMKGTTGYMEEQYDQEVEDITKQEKEDELLFHEDNEWTQKAIRAVQAAKEKLKELEETQTTALAASSAAGSRSKKRDEDLDFFFYSAPPHLYLSPLDIRILKTQFGSFADFPTTLLPRVEHISTGNTVDDVMRKRAKYLGHLPRGCLISFLECDWTDIVTPEVLETFKEEIERRRKRNKDKVAQEERERLQAERLEVAAIRGARRQAGPLLDEGIIRYGNADADRPPVNMDDFIPLGAEAPSTTPPNPRAGFGSLSEMSTSPGAQRTVWGTPAIQGDEPEYMTPRNPVDDGWLKDDDVIDSLSAQDIAFQMEAMGLENGAAGSSSAAAVAATAGSAVGGNKAAGGAKGGKKKKQKITLMSTGGRRGL
ncbi:hypothetical protein B0T20DRAFT_132197 [Sordaria brevicollis]|uniref:RING-type domain-containing protein n=1 Tax=Sordaria brevicollis TaxID=83679 RepID=A0AAE0UFF6_SORBR|nr:hypothetical protein B0T20DRAFT_132197 [Sordaria brevicollis]